MDAIINILKAPGMTSNNVVYDVRRIIGEKRVGHSGTLDPGAAGVLPILVGKATRIFDYIVEKEKEYITEFAFGASTDTLDSYGKVTAVSDRTVSERDFVSAMGAFVGEISQIAPMYSAVLHNGEKLYKLARAGEVVERKSRTVTIHSMELLGHNVPNRFLVKIVCSKGTYVRTLASDIGAALGVPAYVSFLLRSRSGSFCVENAIDVCELRSVVETGRLQSVAMPMDEALINYPEIRLSPRREFEKRLLVNGADIKCDLADTDTVRVYCGEFLGLGRAMRGKLSLKLNLYRGE